MSGRSKLDATVDLLTAYKTWIGVGVLGVVIADAAGLLALSDYLNGLPNVGKEVKVGLVAALGGLLLAWGPATKIVNWIYDPPEVHLLELDARETDIALYKLSPQQFADMTVVHDELYRMHGEVEVWCCRAYVPDRNTAIGTWMGSASDMELVRERERIEEIRGTLEDEAKKGVRLRMQLSSIVRDAVGRITNDFIKTYEGETIYAGDRIGDAVDDALDEYELDSPGNDPETPDAQEETGKEATGEKVDPTESIEQPVAADGGTDK